MSVEEGKKEKESVWGRIKKCFRLSFPRAWATSVWLLKIMIPVTFGVLILEHTGVLAIIADWVAPFFQMIGLPGKSALVLLSSIFANIYSAIAVITTLGFDMRSAIILAVMCLISHVCIVEAAVIRKTGSNLYLMLLLRIVVSMIAGVLLNFILPEFAGTVGRMLEGETLTFNDKFMGWLESSFFLMIKVIVLIVLLMFLQKMLEEFGVIKYLTRFLKPVMKVMGLPEKTTFSWIVANTLGLGYGSAIIIDEVKEGKINRDEVECLNTHIVLSHSLLEDPLLFVAIGLPIGWLIWPRLFLAIAAVWIRKLLLLIFKNKKVNIAD